DRALDLLGDESEKLRPLFVSFDERDGVEKLAAYVSDVDPRIVGLTGTVKQIQDVGRSFRVRREHVHVTQTEEPGHHRINHTTWIFLVDPEGRTLAYYYHTIEPAELAAEIRTHLARPSARVSARSR
ncbi:MAG: SCO family protein, partial [Myxococcales bacterium]|nr:SCO family protein [Myxococcales bacterium]